MSCCARCGEGICTTAGKIALNKAWHKGCFSCYNCDRALQIHSAKIYYGEVFCNCCCPQAQEIYPLKVCRVNSTPSFNPDCSNRMMKPVCCASSDSDCRPRDVHSCSCIPACCTRQYSPPCNCRDCDEPCYNKPCFKRIQCVPRPPRPVNYPPRQRPQRCSCAKCRPRSPKRRICSPPPSPPEPCCNFAKPPPPCGKPACCDGKKKMIYFQPCPPAPCANAFAACKKSCEKPSEKPCESYCCRYCNVERCKRCGEKVFAAEKVMTSHGAYHLGCFSCHCCCKSLCVKSMYEACGEIYCRQCYNNYFGVSGYRYCC